MFSFCIISCKNKKFDYEDAYKEAVSIGYNKTYEEFLNDICTVTLKISKIYKNDDNVMIVEFTDGTVIEIGEFEDPLDDVVHNIIITNRISSLYVTETFQVSYSSTYDNPIVSFSSSDTSIASINNQGLIEAKKVGIVTITVSINNGEIFDSFTLSVIEKKPIIIEEMKPEEDEPDLKSYAIDVSTIKNGESYIIDKSGIYNVFGENQNAQLVVNSLNIDVILVLNNLTLNYNGTTPTIFVQAANSVIIKTYDNTINTISDSQNNLEKGTIVVKTTNLILKGNGVLNVLGNGTTENNSGNAIYNSKELSIYSGEYQLTSNNNGIVGKDLLAINNGTFNISSKTDCLKSTDNSISIFGGNFELNALSDGVQAENIIAINGGTFNISSSGDGIKATNEVLINNGLITIDALEDGIKANGDETFINNTLGNVVINSGEININSLGDGIQAQSSLIINDGIINIISNSGSSGTIKKDELNQEISCKGLKATTNIIINDGEISINSCEDSIHSNDAIEINNGTFNLQSKYDSISSDSTLVIKDGIYNIKAGNGANSKITTYSCKGLKATSEMIINGGTFNINTSDDCVHSNANITLNGGNFEVASADDAFHADNTLKINEGIINISKSYEGLEGSNITINGGKTTLVASDDGINAAGGNDGSGGFWGSSSNNHLIQFNGGVIYINASGDGIDANGSIEMNDGIVVVFGPTTGGNGNFDFDKSCTVNGGTIIICGTRDMLQTPATTSKQCTISVTFDSAQTANKAVAFTIGDKILVVEPPKKYQNVMISTSDIKQGMNILVQYNGISTNCVDKFYYTDTFSATTLTTLTISSVITTYGSAGSNPGGGPGGGPGGRPPRG